MREHSLTLFDKTDPMKKEILTLICSICLVTFCSGQTRVADSLRHLLRITDQDTVRVKANIELGFEVANYNPDSGVIYINEALALATKINYRMGMANAYSTLGHVLTFLGKYKESLRFNGKPW